MRARRQGWRLAPLLVVPLLVVLVAAAAGRPALGQTAPGPAPTEPGGAAIYHAYCSYCHDDGTVGAPRLDDAEAWRQRRPQGAAALAERAWQGHNAMPARSLREELTPERVRAAVDYMLGRLDAAP